MATEAFYQKRMPTNLHALRTNKPLPPISSRYSNLTADERSFNSPISPSHSSRSLLSDSYEPKRHDDDHQYYSGSRNGTRGRQGSPEFADDIPLRAQPPSDPLARDAPRSDALETEQGARDPPTKKPRRSRRREPERKPKIPWVVFTLTAIQVAVFIAQLVKNGVLTNTPIQIQPRFNPMIGPSIYVTINMGARYVPCQKKVLGLPADLTWPCPWSTTSDITSPMNKCTLSQLCGFSDVSDQPNQWYRFIIPMFLHAGIIHIAFNMLLQLTLGVEMERIIGPLRFLIVYLCSGIFGFVLGGNFAAQGIASTGASGALFGIIATLLLDLLYTWKERKSPGKELAFIALDVIVSFVLGLLPGLDNFSHIGGFLMGLVLGVCILHSPNSLRKSVVTDEEQSQARPSSSRKRTVPKFDGIQEFVKHPIAFFRGRKPLWWAWWLVRAGALFGVLVSFILLLNNFYVTQNTCSWCKYLSCLPVNNWCNVGNIQITNSTTNKRDLFGMTAPSDLQAFF